jgi:hypothetical protein
VESSRSGQKGTQVHVCWPWFCFWPGWPWWYLARSWLIGKSNFIELSGALPGSLFFYFGCDILSRHHETGGFMDENFKIGVKIKLKHGILLEALAKRGWNQSDAAKFFGVNPTTFGKWINLKSKKLI